MNSILLTIALAAAVQTHTPTATVSGDIVTVQADFAFVDQAGSTTAVVVPVSIKEGTILAGDYSLLASTDGIKPVSWQLPPGDYTITAFGFPDNRLVPMRTKVVLDVTILSPSRQQQIAEALKAYSIAAYEVAVAAAELKTLKPTKAELAAALTP